MPIIRIANDGSTQVVRATASVNVNTLINGTPVTLDFMSGGRKIATVRTSPNTITTGPRTGRVIYTFGDGVVATDSHPFREIGRLTPINHYLAIPGKSYVIRMSQTQTMDTDVIPDSGAQSQEGVICLSRIIGPFTDGDAHLVMRRVVTALSEDAGRMRASQMNLPEVPSNPEPETPAPNPPQERMVVILRKKVEEGGRRHKFVPVVRRVLVYPEGEKEFGSIRPNTLSTMGIRITNPPDSTGSGFVFGSAGRQFTRECIRFIGMNPLLGDRDKLKFDPAYLQQNQGLLLNTGMKQVNIDAANNTLGARGGFYDVIIFAVPDAGQIGPDGMV